MEEKHFILEDIGSDKIDSDKINFQRCHFD